MRDLRLYSDPACTDFLAALAEAFGVPRECVFASNGSDESLAFAFRAFCDKGAAFPDVTYGFYPVFAQLFGIRTRVVPLREDWSLAPEDYKGLAETLFLANPNAPTGLAPVSYTHLDVYKRQALSGCVDARTGRIPPALGVSVPRFHPADLGHGGGARLPPCLLYTSLRSR